MTVAVALLGLWAPQELGGSDDGLEWARAIDELDLSFRSGDFEARVSGELNLRAYFFGREAPGLTLESAAFRGRHYDMTRFPDSPEFGRKILLFADATYQDWLTASLELRGDRAISAEQGEAYDGRAEQYWVRLSLPDSSPVNLQLGKFSPPLGNFLGRHASKTNPLTTYPLPYDHVTTYISLRDQASNLIFRRDIQDRKHWRPAIWEEVYAHGVMLFGRLEGWSGSAALMNSSPTTWAYDWEFDTRDLRDPVGYVRLAYSPAAAARFGASWTRGPYTKHDDPLTPAGADPGDYEQTLAGIDAAWSVGHLDLFAEVIVSRFESPRVDDLELLTYYVEAKLTFLPGLFGAVRLAQMRFGTIEDASGVTRRWDRDHTRMEAGAGYFLTRNFFIKLTGQVNETLGGREPSDNLVVTELVLTF